MLKFKGRYDQHPRYDRKGKSKFRAFGIPTVDEIEEIIAPMTADTILQILRGQAIYWGYEIERHTDNYVNTEIGKKDEEKERIREEQIELRREQDRIVRVRKEQEKLKRHIEKERRKHQVKRWYSQPDFTKAQWVIIRVLMRGTKMSREQAIATMLANWR